MSKHTHTPPFIHFSEGSFEAGPYTRLSQCRFVKEVQHGY